LAPVKQTPTENVTPEMIVHVSVNVEVVKYRCAKYSMWN